MILDINLSKKLYSNLDLTNNNIKGEFLLLKQFEEEFDEGDIEWNKLDADKKQLKRLITLKNVKKTLPSDRKDYFRVEEFIIDLHEAINICLDKIESFNIPSYMEEFFIRIKTILLLEKIIINSYRDPRRIKNLHYSIIKTLVYDCINGEYEEIFIEKIGVLYFESKIDALNWILANDSLPSESL